MSNINASKIDAIKQEAYETNVANRILDLLRNLRYSSNENSPRRWIWELVQNAKDVVNSTGKIKIQVNFDEEKQILEFSHNGAPFTLKHLIYLMEQVSTKDRSSGESSSKKTGKFGTGFLTTHLLSTKVLVSGILLEDSTPQSFEALLDRSGKTKEELLSAINNTDAQLKSSLTDAILYAEDNYNTSFKYQLDQRGLQVAKQGLEDMDVSIPYVLSLIPEIECITVQPQGKRYYVEKITDLSLEGGKVYRVASQLGYTKKNTYIFVLTKNDVSILLPIYNENEMPACDKIPESLPKLFCDFPLIGTHDFSFPVVINSARFNPTEPRDGIFLTDTEDELIEENKKIMREAIQLYKDFSDYTVEKQWKKIFNVSNTREVVKKDWLSFEWVKENVLNECREAIKYTTLVDTHIGVRESLYDIFKEQQISIPNSREKEVRNTIWKLANEIDYEFLPLHEEIHEWYAALWSECRNLSAKDLVEHISNFKNIDTLSSKLKSQSPVSFLSDLYNLIATQDELLLEIKNDRIAIIPNQNGDFCFYSQVYLDKNIENEYKNIITLLGEDIRSSLIMNEIGIIPLQISRFLDSNYIVERIKDLLDSDDYTDTEYYTACFSIIGLYTECENGDSVTINNFVCELYGSDYSYIAQPIRDFSEELREKALRKICNRLVDDISKQKSIHNLAMKISKTDDEALDFLADIIEFLRIQKFDNYFERKQSILPNQYGIFTPKDSLFLDAEIDDCLKDLANIASYDIRKELLSQKIFLEIPREKNNADLSTHIENYARKNYSNKSLANTDWAFFRRQLFLWIKDHPEESKRLFPTLSDNKHWLYDEDEIATNMKKAEKVESMMDELGIDSIDNLKEILKSISSGKNEDTSKGLISDDVLIQWGIDSPEALEKAFTNKQFADEFCRESSHTVERFEYVQKIIERAKNNIISYLSQRADYDLANIEQIAETTFVIKKNGEEIYLITRPSDGGEIRLYYDTEKDTLDFTKDWELWVEDGKSTPEKITFGKIIKLTGINRIPLKKLKG